MSENNLNKVNKAEEAEDTNLLHESVLLNIDIFSSEFEDEIEEDRVSEVELVEIESEEVEDSTGETENKDAFILSIEDDIEESDMYKSKREFNGYMSKFPKKKQKEKTTKAIKSKSKHEPKHEYRPIKRPKEAKLASKDIFDVNKEPISKEAPKITKKKTNPFNISERDFKRSQHSKTKDKEFLMEISKKEKKQFSMDLNQKVKVQEVVKNENRLMSTNFDKEDKMNLNKKNNLKIGVL